MIQKPRIYTGDDVREHEMSAVLQDFMSFSTAAENENIQKYLRETFIPNVRNGINAVLTNFRIDLKMENNQYFHNPGGEDYTNILPIPTGALPGLRGAVGIVLDRLQGSSNNNSKIAYNESLAVLTNELKKLQETKNAVAEQAQRAVDDIRDQTNQAVQNTMPETRQLPEDPTAQQKPIPQQQTKVQSEHSRATQKHDAAHEHASHNDDHHKSKNKFVSALSWVWGARKYFNLFGPDFWAWNRSGQNGGHGHGHGGHGH